MKGASCVTHLSCVKPVTNVKNAASNPPIGARLQNFWQTWLNLGAGPKILQILHSPLPDPAKLDKISHCHKPLCKPSQEQLPVRGFTSAYLKKCNRAGTKSKISGIFQQTLSGAQTQQQMEAHLRPEQIKSLPQGGEIEDGNTRNHQNIPPTRGVGHFNRFQGRLLPYTNTGTIQEISEISCPRSDILVQGPALWSVHSTLGVHCGSKGSEINGHAQGYKDPPVSRRLVGKSKVPPSLSPAYQGPGENMSRPRLASKFREIRAGTKASL